MSRPTHPRSARSHAVAAAGVLRRYTADTGWAPALPVPVEDIIERVFDLRILWQVIPEPSGSQILGALDPSAKTICLNETHAESVLSRIGPLNFTYAHELGHWLYDADDPNQLQLLNGTSQKFCRDMRSVVDADHLREVNANKFAAHLLLPEDLVREAIAEVPPGAPLASLAKEWGVSVRTLEIRIDDELGIGTTAEDGRLF